MRMPRSQGGQRLEPTLDRLRPIPGSRRLRRILVTFAAAALICVLLDQNAFHYLESYAYDFAIKVYADHDPSAVAAARRRIVLVTLTDNSFASGALRGAPPLPRSYHAKVIRELTRAGAKVIVFDLLFDTENTSDAELAAAARSSGKTLWACLRESDRDSDAPRWVMPNATLRQASTRIGHCLVPEDADTPVADRIQPVLVRKGEKIPALSVKAAMMSAGVDGQAIRRTRDGWRIGSLKIPVNKDGCFRISYLGKPEQVFASVPYELIYLGAVNDEFYRKNRFFDGKIVLIGDTTTVTSDYLNTPVGVMSGVEIHAHAIATLLQGRFVREAPGWLNVLAICVAAALVSFLWRIKSLFRAGLTMAALLAGWLMVSVWIFSASRLWLHMVAPMAGMLIGTMGLLGERALTEELEKKRMRWLLRRYVSPEIAEYIIANPDACVLGGKRVTATVLFADIRGFTDVSERLSPETVVKHLNEFFEAMTAVAFAHDGTVDKYVGDAIMVLFGIPVPYPDHARRAVATAIDMQTAIIDLQKRWQAEGLPLMDIGIGVNTGIMVAGSIGSTQRVEFTVIGDDVNTASRIQDLNRELGTRILVAQSTYEAVREDVIARGPLVGSVKGKEFTAFEIQGWRDTAEQSADTTTDRLRPTSRP